MPICTKIEWAEEPHPAPCAIGEPANCSGLFLQATYEDDTQGLVEVTQRMLNESSLHTTASIRKSIINYLGHRLPIIIPVLDIMLDHVQATAKNELLGKVGEPFDKSQITVTAFYSDGTSKEVGNYKIVPGKELLSTTKEITVKYGRCTTTLPITISSAEASAPTHEPTEMLSTFRDRQLTSTVSAENGVGGALQQLLEEKMTNNTALSTKQPGAVSERSREPSDQDNALLAVSIAQMPTKLNYEVNEAEADLSGGKLNLVYEDGRIEQIDMKPDGKVSLTCSAPGRGFVSFTYSGKSITYPVEVRAPAVAIGLELRNMPYKTVYEQGTLELDMTGGKVTVHYSDGTDNVIPVSPDMIGPYNFGEVGQTNIFIMHQGLSVICPVNVIPKATVITGENTGISSPVRTSLAGSKTGASTGDGREGDQIPTVETVQKPKTSGECNLGQPVTTQDDIPEKEGLEPILPEPQELPKPAKPVPDFYVSTFGLRFSIEDEF